MATKMEQLCNQVISAREARDALKAQLETCDKELGKVEAELALVLAEGESKYSFGGFSFSSALKINWKTRKEGKEELVGLLKKGVPELVQETVNAASLSAYLRKNESALESENASWWARAKACLERSELHTLSVRKDAKKK